MADPFTALAIDCGATSGRAVLGTLDANDKLSLEEIHRWPNAIVTTAGEMHWEFARLAGEIESAIDRCWQAGHAPQSMAIDTWGVDYLLVDVNGRPLGEPVAYRDGRTEGVRERVWQEIIPDAEIFAVTGIQSIFINTLYQLAADVFANKERLQQAHALLMMPNALAVHLGARPCAEYTIASTTQLLDARQRDWSRTLAEKIGIPAKILPEVVAPTSRIGTYEGRGNGNDTGNAGRSLAIVAGASHDTAAAVAAIPAETGKPWAYISSGTWLLVGVESKEPCLTEDARRARLTNEGGVEETYRLLTNVTGLWLIEEAIRMWREGGQEVDIVEVCGQAADAPGDGPLIDPNDESFNSPDNMLDAIAAFCRRTGQSPPEGVGAMARCIFESLGLKTAAVLDTIARITGTRPEVLHLVGGGSKNELLCQMTADAFGAPLIAGPAECTSTGNLLIQALAAGRVKDLAELRAIVRANSNLTTYTPAGDPYWSKRKEQLARL